MKSKWKDIWNILFILTLLWMMFGCWQFLAGFWWLKGCLGLTYENPITIFTYWLVHDSPSHLGYNLACAWVVSVLLVYLISIFETESLEREGKNKQIVGLVHIVSYISRNLKIVYLSSTISGGPIAALLFLLLRPEGKSGGGSGIVYSFLGLVILVAIILFIPSLISRKPVLCLQSGVIAVILLYFVFTSNIGVHHALALISGLIFSPILAYVCIYIGRKLFGR